MTDKALKQTAGFMPMQKVKFKFRRTKLTLNRMRIAANKVFPTQEIAPQVPCTNVELTIPTHPLADLGITWAAWASQLEHGNLSTLEQLNLGIKSTLH